MELLREAAAGSGEADDALVVAAPADTLEIEVTSVVYALYGEAIYRAAAETLAGLGVAAGRIAVQDQGAVDAVVRARVEAAVRRAAGTEDV